MVLPSSGAAAIDAQGHRDCLGTLQLGRCGHGLHCIYGVSGQGTGMAGEPNCRRGQVGRVGQLPCRWDSITLCLHAIHPP